jgi:hypothetical protein
MAIDLTRNPSISLVLASNLTVRRSLQREIWVSLVWVAGSMNFQIDTLIA